jgi:hypothetical protein
VLLTRQALGSPSPSSLAAIGATLAAQQAKAEARQAHEVKSTTDRQALIHEAVGSVRRILQHLIKAVRDQAPTSENVPSENENVDMVSYEIRLGGVALKAWVYPRLSDWMRGVCQEAGWEVLAGVLLWIETPKSQTPGDSPSGYRSANLWFGKLSRDSEYRWWEAAYLTGAPVEAPIGLDHWRENIEPKLTDGPWLIDGEHMGKFFDRWTNRLAEAVQLEQLGSQP